MHLVDRRRPGPVVRVPGKDDPVRQPLGVQEGAGADGVAREIAAQPGKRVGTRDAEFVQVPPGQVAEGVVLQPEDDGPRIAHPDVIHHGGEHLLLRVAEIGGELPLEAEPDRLGVERGPVVEANAVSDRHVHASAAVRNGPRFGDSRLRAAAVVPDIHERVEEEPLDPDRPLGVPLGRGVQALRLALQGVYKDRGVCHTSTPISLSSGKAPGINRRFLTRA